MAAHLEGSIFFFVFVFFFMRRRSASALKLISICHKADSSVNVINKNASCAVDTRVAHARGNGNDDRVRSIGKFYISISCQMDFLMLVR